MDKNKKKRLAKGPIRNLFQKEKRKANQFTKLGYSILAATGLMTTNACKKSGGGEDFIDTPTTPTTPTTPITPILPSPDSGGGTGTTDTTTITDPNSGGGGSTDTMTVTDPNNGGGGSTDTMTVTDPNNGGGGSTDTMTVTDPNNGGGGSTDTMTVTDPNSGGGGSTDTMTVTDPNNGGGGSTDTMTVTDPQPQNIIGTSADDILIGTNGEEKIEGLEGNDIIWGKLGNDEMLGSSGDDIFVVIGSDGVSYNYNEASLVIDASRLISRDTDLDLGNVLGLKLEDILTAADAIPEVTGSAIISGGEGIDELIIYGRVDLSRSIVSVENLIVNSRLTVDASQLDEFAGKTTIHGRSDESSLIIKGDGTIDLSKIDIQGEINILAEDETGESLDTTFIVSDNIIDNIAEGKVKLYFGDQSKTTSIDVGTVTSSDDLESVRRVIETNEDSLTDNNGNINVKGTYTFDDTAEELSAQMEGDIIQFLFGGAYHSRFAGTSLAADRAHGADSERLSGSNGDDIIEGGAGNDIIKGGMGNDIALYGVSAAAVLRIETEGNRIVIAGEGQDALRNIQTILGGDFNDDFDLSGSAAIKIDGGRGINSLSISDLTYFDLTQEGKINHHSVKNIQLLILNDGNDSVKIDLADTAIQVIHGGDGVDTINLYSLTSGHYLDLRTTNRFIAFENIVGTEFDDILGGDERNNSLTGGKGGDTFIISRGNDIITDFTAEDKLDFTNGDITFKNFHDDLTFMNQGNDLLISFMTEGDTETSTLTISNFWDVATATAEDKETLNEYFSNGAGSEYINFINVIKLDKNNDGTISDDEFSAFSLNEEGYYQTKEGSIDILDFAGSSSVFLTIKDKYYSTNATYMIESVEGAYGTEDDDWFIGSIDDNIFDGRGGELDIMEYLAGTYHIGGANGDFIITGKELDGTDIGVDRIRNIEIIDIDISTGTHFTLSQAFSVSISDGSDIPSATIQQSGNYRIDKTELIFGENERGLRDINEIDNLFLSSGNDILTINLGSSFGNIHGGGGTDTILLSDDITDFELTNLFDFDFIIGNALNNKITGGASNDNISGEAGDDILHGGKGNDSLTGGTGSDTFIISRGNDIITDFTAEDKLDFTNGDIVFKNFHDDLTFTSQGNDLLISFMTEGDTETSTLTISNFWDVATATAEDKENLNEYFTNGAGSEYINFFNIIKLDQNNDGIVSPDEIVDFSLTKYDNYQRLDPMLHNILDFEGLEGGVAVSGSKYESLQTGEFGFTFFNYINGYYGTSADDIVDSLPVDVVHDGRDGEDSLVLYEGSYYEITYTDEGFFMQRNVGGVLTDKHEVKNFEILTGVSYYGNAVEIIFNNIRGGLTLAETVPSWNIEARQTGAYRIVNNELVFGNNEGGLKGIDGISGLKLSSGDDLLTIDSGGLTIGTIDGGAGRDTLTLTSYANTDKIINAVNFEVVNGNEFANIISLTGGSANTINGYGGDDILTGSDEIDYIFGGNGNDILNGGKGINVLKGEAGDDILKGGIDDDTYFGGTGDDTFILSGGTDTIHDFEYSDKILFENLESLGGNNALLFGLSGNDLQIVYSVMGTEDGFLTIRNFLNLIPNSDLPTTEERKLANIKAYLSERLISTQIESVMNVINVKDDSLSGTNTERYDVLDFSGYDEGVVFSLENNSFTFNYQSFTSVASVEGIYGTDSSDIFFGDDADNLFDGRGGYDELSLRLGSYDIAGKAGDLWVSGMQVYNDFGSIGKDRLINVESFRVDRGITNLNFFKAFEDVHITGNTGAYLTITISETGDYILDQHILKFGDNEDGLHFDIAPRAITLSDGDDTLRLNSAWDIVHGGEGYDKLILGDGATNIDLSITTGFESIEGNDADNIIKGGSIDETINGGRGNDVISGGGGKDSFLTSRGNDRITDFTADDLIDFTSSGFYINGGYRGMSFTTTGSDLAIAYSIIGEVGTHTLTIAGFWDVVVATDEDKADLNSYFSTGNGAQYIKSQLAIKLDQDGDNKISDDEFVAFGTGASGYQQTSDDRYDILDFAGFGSHLVDDGTISLHIDLANNEYSYKYATTDGTKTIESVEGAYGSDGYGDIFTGNSADNFFDGRGGTDTIRYQGGIYSITTNSIGYHIEGYLEDYTSTGIDTITNIEIVDFKDDSSLILDRLITDLEFRNVVTLGITKAGNYRLENEEIIYDTDENGFNINAIQGLYLSNDDDVLTLHGNSIFTGQTFGRQGDDTLILAENYLIDLSISNFESFETIIGNDADNVLLYDEIGHLNLHIKENAGTISIDDTYSLISIEKIMTGDYDDSFTFAEAITNTVSIDAAGGNNVINYDASGIIDFTENSKIDSLEFANIQTLNLRGDDNTLSINEANAGFSVIASGSDNTLALTHSTGQVFNLSESELYKGFEHLTGTNYDDVLTGDDEANTLNGGDGNDRLTGGLGADTYIASRGNDVITDFSRGDIVEFSNININPTGTFDGFTFSKVNDDLIIAFTAKGDLEQSTLTINNFWNAVDSSDAPNAEELQDLHSYFTDGDGAKYIHSAHIIRLDQDDNDFISERELISISGNDNRFDIIDFAGADFVDAYFDAYVIDGVSYKIDSIEGFYGSVNEELQMYDRFFSDKLYDSTGDKFMIGNHVFNGRRDDDDYDDIDVVEYSAEATYSISGKDNDLTVTRMLSDGQVASIDRLFEIEEIVVRTVGYSGYGSEFILDKAFAISLSDNTEDYRIASAEILQEGVYSLESDTLTFGDNAEGLKSVSDIVELTLSSGDDKLIYNNLDERGFNEVISGGAGTDILQIGDNYKDIDILQQGFKDFETIIGNDFDNVIIGSDNGETIIGGGGADTLNGGGGDDILTDESGDTIYVASRGNDIVQNFKIGDTIALWHPSINPTGTLSSMTFTASGDDLIITYTAKGDSEESSLTVIDFWNAIADEHVPTQEVKDNRLKEYFEHGSGSHYVKSAHVIKLDQNGDGIVSESEVVNFGLSETGYQQTREDRIDIIDFTGVTAGLNVIAEDVYSFGTHTATIESVEGFYGGAHDDVFSITNTNAFVHGGEGNDRINYLDSSSFSIEKSEGTYIARYDETASGLSRLDTLISVETIGLPASVGAATLSHLFLDLGIAKTEDEAINIVLPQPTDYQILNNKFILLFDDYNNIELENIAQITLSDGDDSILYTHAFEGSTIFHGGGGIDTLSLYIYHKDFDATNFIDFEIIQGNYQDNIITGSSTDETIYGGAGNDILNGGGGSDTLYGGTGVDTFVATGNVIIADFTNDDLLSFLDSNLYASKTFEFVGNDLKFSYSLTTNEQGNVIITDFKNLLTLEQLQSSLDDVVKSYTADENRKNIIKLDVNGDGMIDDSEFQVSHDTFNDKIDIIDFSGASQFVKIDLSENKYYVGDIVAPFASVEGAIGSSHADEFIGDSNDNEFTGSGFDAYLISSGSYVLENSYSRIRISGTDSQGNSIGTDTLNGISRIKIQDTGASEFVMSELYPYLDITGEGKIDIRIETEGKYYLVNNQILQYSGGSLYGTNGFNSLTLSAGDDHIDFSSVINLDYTLDAGTGRDTLQLGYYLTDVAISDKFIGFDVIIGNNRLNKITGTVYGEEIYARGNDDTIYGIGGDDKLFGESGDDWLYGGIGSDTLHGGNDDDFLDGGVGNDILIGGTGTDRFILSSGDDAVNDFTAGDSIDYFNGEIDFANGFDDLTFAINGDDLLISYTQGSMTVYGFLSAIAQEDAPTDEDKATEASLRDYFATGKGNTYINDRNFITSASNADYGLSQPDSHKTYADRDDILDFSNHATAIGADLQTDIYSTAGSQYKLESVDGLIGSRYADSLRGDDGANILSGKDGNDVINGRGGDDILTGGNGADTFIASRGHDVITDFGALDRIKFSQNYISYSQDYSNFTFSIEGDDLFIEFTDISFNNQNSLRLNNFFNNIYYDDLPSSLEKETYDNLREYFLNGAGSSYIINDDYHTIIVSENPSSDTYAYPLSFGTLESGNQQTYDNKLEITDFRGVDTRIFLDFEDGTYRLANNTNTYTIESVEGAYGTRHIDILYGDAGRNKFDGRDGNDIINGRGGDDILTGGNGADTFIASRGHDVITDFSSEDMIEFSELGLDPFTNTYSGFTFSIDEDDLVIAYRVGDDSDVSSLRAVNFWNSIESQHAPTQGDRLSDASLKNYFINGGGSHYISDIHISYLNVFGDGRSIDSSRYLPFGTDELSYRRTEENRYDVVHFEGAPLAVTINLQDEVYNIGTHTLTLQSVEGAYGTSHRDDFTGDSGNNIFDGKDGFDEVHYNAGNYRITGTHNDFTITGSDNNGNDVGMDRFLNVEGFTSAGSNVVLEEFIALDITADTITLQETGIYSLVYGTDLSFLNDLDSVLGLYDVSKLYLSAGNDILSVDDYGLEFDQIDGGAGYNILTFTGGIKQKLSAYLNFQLIIGSDEADIFFSDGNRNIDLAGGNDNIIVGIGDKITTGTGQDNIYVDLSYDTGGTITLTDFESGVDKLFIKKPLLGSSISKNAEMDIVIGDGGTMDIVIDVATSIDTGDSTSLLASTGDIIIYDEVKISTASTSNIREYNLLNPENERLFMSDESVLVFDGIRSMRLLELSHTDGFLDFSETDGNLNLIFANDGTITIDKTEDFNADTNNDAAISFNEFVEAIGGENHLIFN